MKIWIEPNALSVKKDDFLAAGAVHVLALLMENGHALGMDDSTLTPIQQRFLENEGLFSLQKKEEAGGIIRQDTDTDELVFVKDEDPLARGADWNDLYKNMVPIFHRKATIKRKTHETDIEIEMNLDGTGKADIDTGLKFFDHMLDQIAKHGLVDLKLICKGDLEVDEHHTIEDVAIALGEAITRALGDKKGINRYGFVLPMDEAQATVAIDLSGRPFLVFKGEFTREYVGDFPTEMVKHFFYSLAMNLKATLHISFFGENDHHKIEACFKGFARSLKMCVEKNPRIKNQIPSSKGTL